MVRKINKNLVVYQAKNGKIEFKGDFVNETIWANLNQISDLFYVQKAAISKHLSNIYAEKELQKSSTVSKMETVQIEGKRKVARKIEYYNLDAILSVGYRVNSRQATQFRIWATNVLKQHVLKGFTINPERVIINYRSFAKAISDIKTLLPANEKIKAQDALELANVFANTWFSLEAYDKSKFLEKGTNVKKIKITANELEVEFEKFKRELIKKKKVVSIFGQKTKKDPISNIINNIFQSFAGKEVYPSLEEKAAHLLYFIVKDHPFVDGNKRHGAFAFVWFLRKAGLLRFTLTPEALTAITLLVAESNPKDKNKVIGIILLLLNRK